MGAGGRNRPLGIREVGGGRSGKVCGRSIGVVHVSVSSASGIGAPGRRERRRLPRVERCVFGGHPRPRGGSHKGKVRARVAGKPWGAEQSDRVPDSRRRGETVKNNDRASEPNPNPCGSERLRDPQGTRVPGVGRLAAGVPEGQPGQPCLRIVLLNAGVPFSWLRGRSPSATSSPSTIARRVSSVGSLAGFCSRHHGRRRLAPRALRVSGLRVRSPLATRLGDGWTPIGTCRGR